MEKFIIPLQSAVSKYMKEKMHWPQEFCDHFADKFWNFYNSTGWKLNGNKKMKSWQSAFNNNWKDLRFAEDKQKLVNILKALEQRKQFELMTHDEFLLYIDGWLERYKHEQRPSRELALKIYEELKRRGMAKLSTEKINMARVQGGNSVENCRMWALKYMLDEMIERGYSFTDRYGSQYIKGVPQDGDILAYDSKEGGLTPKQPEQ